MMMFEDNVEIDLKYISYELVNWINLAHNGDRRWTFLKQILKFLYYPKCREFPHHLKDRILKKTGIGHDLDGGSLEIFLGTVRQC